MLDWFATAGTYWFCLGLGVIIIGVAAMVGHAFDTGAHDAGPLSLPVLSFFLTAFGGGGLVAIHVLHLAGFASVAVASLSGAGGSLAFYFGIYRLLISQQGGTSNEPDEVVGREADVLTSIPRDGLGEITYITKSGRMSAAARSTDNSPIPRNTTVRIVRAMGTTFIVEPLAVPSASNGEKS